MQLTKQDVLFIQTVKRVSEYNKDYPEDKKTVVTSKAYFSDDLIELLELKDKKQGSWIFNVYVEFEPLYRETPAKEWQK